MAVEESNLSVQVAAIRRVLRDAPGAARWIETRACRGYRYIGPEVERHERSAPSDLLSPGSDAGADPGDAKPAAPIITAPAPSHPKWPTSSTEWSDVFGLIYDAGLAFERWPAALERLAEILGASTACLVKHDPATATGAMINVRSDPSVAKCYAEYFARRNVLAERAGIRPAQTVITDRMVLSKEELFATEFYNDFLRPRDVHSILTAYVLDNGATRVSFGRAHRAGEWSREHVDCLRLLAPHLYRAVQGNLRLEAVQMLQEGAADALDRLGQSAMIVDADSRPLLVNRAMRALLERGDGLHINGEGLSALDATETTSIRRLIAARDEDQRRMPAAPLRVSRRDAQPPLALIVMPMRASPGWFGQQSPAALILINDAAARPHERVLENGRGPLRTLCR
jgi:PAS domain-containing protein